MIVYTIILQQTVNHMVKLNIWLYLGIFSPATKNIECILRNYDTANLESGELNLTYDFF